MKTKFNIGKIEIQGVVVENISIEAEYTIAEVKEAVVFGKNFMQELMEEAPQMLESLERAWNKFNEIDDRVEKKQEAQPKTNFGYAYDNNVNAIKELISSGNMTTALEAIEQTDNICHNAYSKKEIDIKTLHDCRIELMKLRNVIFSCSF